jgi:hypothetical protein
LPPGTVTVMNNYGSESGSVKKLKEILYKKSSAVEPKIFLLALASRKSELWFLLWPGSRYFYKIP